MSAVQRMTGPELYQQALRLREQAASWMDADTGWRAALTAEQRLAYRMADLAEAQICATLAVAAATALGSPVAAVALDEQPDLDAWITVAGVTPS